MDTIELLKEVKSFLEKKVLIEKAPRVQKNLKIINLILDWFSYQDIADKLWVSRQAIWDIVENSKKLLEKA